MEASIDTRRHYEDLAYVMNQAKSSGYCKKRKQRYRKLESQLKQERDRHKRSGRVWQPKQARSALVQKLATSFHVARREREAALAATRRQDKEQHMRRLGALAAYSKRVTDELEPTAPIWLFRDTWQRPDGELWTDSKHSMPSDRADTVGSVPAIALDGSRAPSPAALFDRRQAVRVCEWAPPVVAMSCILKEMPHVMSAT
jgi:hypothetical protein